MYTACKYVVMEVTDDGKTSQNIFLFPARVIHRAVAKSMRGKPVSAGFVSKNRENGELFCTGFSESLGLTSRNEDNVLLRSLFL